MVARWIGDFRAWLRRVASRFPAELAVGALVTLLLSGMEFFYKHTPDGEDLEVRAFAYLQGKLPRFSQDRPPIVVVNISPLGGGTLEDPTPRAALTRVLEALAVHQPKAIAVDIDFAKRRNGDWASDDDPQFFADCLALSRRTAVPIFLPIERWPDGTTAGLLGLPGYDDLAVRGVSIDEGTERYATRIPLWYFPRGGTHAMPNLPTALAKAWLRERTVPEAPFGVRQLVRPLSIARPDDRPAGQALPSRWIGNALLNYSKIDTFKQQRLNIVPPHFAFAEEDVADRIVILGALGASPDVFAVPAREGTWPGALFQASAAYTLAVEPAREFKPAVAWSLDLAFSLLAIWSLRGIRTRLARRTASADGQHHGWWGVAELVVPQVVPVGIVVLGVLLVGYGRVLWLDFTLLAACVALHPFVAAILERALPAWHSSEAVQPET